ncbi:MAG: sensor histidine kinase [Mycobacteriales bacterium]
MRLLAVHRPSWSLRTRLTAAATLVVAVGVALAGGLLVWRQGTTLQGSLEGQAGDRAEQIADLIGPGAPFAGVAGVLRGDDAVQVLGPTGHVVANSPDLTGQGPVLGFPVTGQVTIRRLANLPVVGGGSYLVAGIRAPNGDRVYVGLPTSEVDQSVGELVTALLVGGPVLTAVLGALGWVLVGLALRPVERMRGQAASITATGLHRRLDAPGGRDELHRLGETLNDLLARLDASTSAQRQFVADAAHELRSPLAGILARLEVAARDSDVQLAPELAAELLPEAQRLGRLVDDLLRLARMDANPRLATRTVDLDDLVFAEVRRVRALTTRNVDETGVTAVQVVGDPDALTRVVGNLLDNAVRHAAAQVKVTLRPVPAGAELSITDDGPGIAPADRERVFERFTRLDDARSRGSGGSGLGLAIAREVVRAHGGDIRIGDGSPAGTVVRVILPLAFTAAGPARTSVAGALR